MKLPSIPFIRGTFRLWLSSCIELLLFLPVWIMFKVYFLPESIEWTWMYLLPLFSLAGVLLRTSLTVRWKQLAGSLFLGAVIGLLSGGISLSAIPMAVAGCLCAYLGMTAYGRLKSTRIYWTGVAIYFFSSFLFHKTPELQSAMPFITIFGSMCLILALIVINNNHLHYSSLSGETTPLPQGLRRHNLLFVILFVITAAVLTAGAGQAIGMLLLNFLRTLIGWLTSLFSGSTEQPLPESAPPAAVPEMPTGEVNEPGLLTAILNVSFYIIAIVVAAFLAYHALLWLYRNTGGILRRAIGILLSILRRELSQPDNGAYVDEEKSIFTWDKTRQSFTEYWRSKLISGARRDRLDPKSGNRERTRWLYRQWLRANKDNGYEVKSHLTPHETGLDVLKWTEHQRDQRTRIKGNTSNPNKLLELYDRVRYGEEEPTIADISNLKEPLK